VVEKGCRDVEPGALGREVTADGRDRVLAGHDGHERLGDGVLVRGPKEDAPSVGPDLLEGDDPSGLEERMASLGRAVLTRPEPTGECPAIALAGVFA
jgi:hypothetical protein